MSQRLSASARGRAEGPRGCAELTARELITLRLLAEGHTDAAIAKRLGLSGRTVRRIATGLMNRLGARSRFAAGVHAVQRGWLPGCPEHPHLVRLPAAAAAGRGPASPPGPMEQLS